VASTSQVGDGAKRGQSAQITDSTIGQKAGFAVSVPLLAGLLIVAVERFEPRDHHRAGLTESLPESFFGQQQQQGTLGA